MSPAYFKKALLAVLSLRGAVSMTQIIKRVTGMGLQSLYIQHIPVGSQSLVLMAYRVRLRGAVSGISALGGLRAFTNGPETPGVMRGFPGL